MRTVSEQGVEALIAKLSADDFRERAGAVRMLGITRHPHATLYLADLIVRRDVVAPLAMRAIGEIGQPNILVERVLFDAYRERFCFNDALRALGRTASVHALPHLLLAAHRDADAALEAVETLLSRHDVAVLPASVKARTLRQLEQLSKKHVAYFAYRVANLAAVISG